MVQILSADLLQVMTDAGFLALRMRSEGLEEKLKSDEGDDFVTRGDKAVSEFLNAELSRLYPRIVIIDEEVAGSHRFDVDTLALGAIIDPIDGTGNYRKGDDRCGISVGIIIDGKPVAGLINRFGRGLLYWAEAGLGAYCNNRQLFVSATHEFSAAHVSYSMPYLKDEQERAWMEKFMGVVVKHVESTEQMGSQVIEAMAVAQGTHDIFVMNNTKPWDIAAAAVIVPAAGGRMFDMTGKPYKIGEPSVIAINGELDLRSVLRLIREV